MTFKLNMRKINSPESVGLNIQISEAWFHHVSLISPKVNISAAILVFVFRTENFSRNQTIWIKNLQQQIILRAMRVWCKSNKSVVLFCLSGIIPILKVVNSTTSECRNHVATDTHLNCHAGSISMSAIKVRNATTWCTNGGASSGWVEEFRGWSAACAVSQGVPEKSWSCVKVKSHGLVISPKRECPVIKGVLVIRQTVWKFSV